MSRLRRDDWFTSISALNLTRFEEIQARSCTPSLPRLSPCPDNVFSIGLKILFNKIVLYSQKFLQMRNIYFGLFVALVRLKGTLIPKRSVYTRSAKLFRYFGCEIFARNEDSSPENRSLRPEIFLDRFYSYWYLNSTKKYSEIDQFQGSCLVWCESLQNSENAILERLMRLNSVERSAKLQ